MRFGCLRDPGNAYYYIPHRIQTVNTPKGYYLSITQMETQSRDQMEDKYQYPEGLLPVYYEYKKYG